VIGANTRVEIWDAQAWATYEAEQEPSFSDISEEVLPGLL
jgi:MraZ protein